MPRSSRKISATGYYHIILRGINRQSIVMDDQDRRKMIDTLRRYSATPDAELVAYCLMDNHLHLLLKADDGASALVKRLASSYVYYFNHKYDRVGHLFQDRYKSEAVETEAYLLTVARYILQNPQKAGVCATEDYPWSSWRDMKTGDGFCDAQILCDCIGSKEALLDFCLSPSNDSCLDTREKKSLNDSEAAKLFQRISGLSSFEEIAAMPRADRNSILSKARAKGLSVRQLARLTGLNRNIIQRV